MSPTIEERGKTIMAAYCRTSAAVSADAEQCQVDGQDTVTGLEIQSTSNPLHHTSTSGSSSAVSTFQIARVGSFLSIL